MSSQRHDAVRASGLIRLEIASPKGHSSELYDGSRPGATAGMKILNLNMNCVCRYHVSEILNNKKSLDD